MKGYGNPVSIQKVADFWKNNTRAQRTTLNGKKVLLDYSDDYEWHSITKRNRRHFQMIEEYADRVQKVPRKY